MIAMKNSISLVSMILMLVVMVIVLLLVARAWTSVAPTAVQITSPSISGLEQDDSDTAQDGECRGAAGSVSFRDELSWPEVDERPN